MIFALASGWGALAIGLLGLGVSLGSLIAKALLASEVRGFVDRVVAAQVRRAGHSLNLDDANEAAAFVEEWNAELADLKDQPISRLQFALALRRASRELNNVRREAPDDEPA